MRNTRIDKMNHDAWDIVIKDPHVALALSQNALYESKRAHYINGMYESYINEAWAYIVLSRLSEAVNLLNSLYDNETIQVKFPQHYSRCLNALGVVYAHMGRFEKALDYYYECVKYLEMNPDTEREAPLYINIGNIYTEIKKFDKALDSYFKTLTVCAPHILEPQATAHICIAYVCKELGMYVQAEHYYLKGLIISSKINHSMNIAAAYGGLATAYQGMRHFTLAETYFFASYNMFYEVGSKRKYSDVLFDLALLYYEQGKHYLAYTNAIRCVSLAEELNILSLIVKVCDFLAYYEELQKNYEQALYYTQKGYNAEREMTENKNESKYRYIEIEYEAERERERTEICQQKNVVLNKKSTELQEAQRRLNLVTTIGQYIVASIDLEEIVKIVYEKLNDIMHVDCCLLAHFQEGDKNVVLPAVFDKGEFIRGVCFPYDDPASLIAYTIREDKVVAIGSYEEIPVPIENRAVFNSTKPPESYILAPLKVKNSIVGAFSIQSMEKDAYTERHLDIFTALCSYIAIASENAKKHFEIEKLNEIISEEKGRLVKANEKISTLAHQDTLTGLPNRRHFSKLFTRAIQDMKKQEEKLALIFIDLNKFKPINDLYGHEIGDEVLKNFASILQDNLRSTDVVARIGGDEFVIFIKNMGSKHAVNKIIETILNRLALPLTIGEMTLSLSVSIGVSIFPDDSHSSKELMRMADEAMFMVKEKNLQTYRYYSEL